MEGGVSAGGGGGMSTGGHLDGEGVDVDAVSQPGMDDDDFDITKPPAGAVLCAPSSCLWPLFCHDGI